MLGILLAYAFWWSVWDARGMITPPTPVITEDNVTCMRMRSAQLVKLEQMQKRFPKTQWSIEPSMLDDCQPYTQEGRMPR